MARFTFTLEGEPLEFRPSLRALLGALAADALDSIGEDDEAATTDGHAAGKEELTPEEFGRLWRAVRPDARDILTAIAEQPDCSFEELQQATGLGGLGIAGRLSSVGHTMRRFFGGKRAPVTRDYQTRRYHMAPDVAELVKRLAASG